MQNTNNYMPFDSMNDLSAHQAIDSRSQTYNTSSFIDSSSVDHVSIPPAKVHIALTFDNLLTRMIPKIFTDFTNMLDTSSVTPTVNVLNSVGGMMLGMVDIKDNGFLTSILMFAYSTCVMHIIQKSKKRDDNDNTMVKKVTTATANTTEDIVVPWYDENKMLPDTQLPSRNDMYDFYSKFTSDDCWNEDAEEVDPKDVGTPGKLTYSTYFFCCYFVSWIVVD